MFSSFQAICSEFSVSVGVQTLLSLRPDREAVLGFLDQLRRQYPGMTQLRRGSRDSLSLAETPGDASGGRWLRLEEYALRCGFKSPPGADKTDEYFRRVLESAPYHLTISPIDLDALEVIYRFDLEYRGNHDLLVARTFFANTCFQELLADPSVQAMVDCQPVWGVSLSQDCRLQAFLEIRGRTTRLEVQTGQFDARPLTVSLSVREYRDSSVPMDLLASYETVTRHACRLAETWAVPAVVAPLAQAIAAPP
jgi:hypothetical protein